MIGFYVTVVRGSKQVGWLLGPFNSKTEAESKVASAKELACKLDPWCDFDAFGVTRVETEKKLHNGKLNDRLGLHT